jgi:hypothetical protein
MAGVFGDTWTRCVLGAALIHEEVATSSSRFKGLNTLGPLARQTTGAPDRPVFGGCLPPNRPPDGRDSRCRAYKRPHSPVLYAEYLPEMAPNRLKVKHCDCFARPPWPQVPEYALGESVVLTEPPGGHRSPTGCTHHAAAVNMHGLSND